LLYESELISHIGDGRQYRREAPTPVTLCQRQCY